LFSGGGDEFEFFDIVNHGRLLGFVGPDPYQGQWGNGGFFPQTSGYISVGSGQSFATPYAGELWLGLNDDAVTEAIGDNGGEVVANITIGGSDVTAPAIAISVPTTVYTLNQNVAAKYSCTDPDDAVVSCAGPVANGVPVDTIDKLDQALSRPVDGLHTFVLAPNPFVREIVLEASGLEAATSQILEEYGIPAAKRLPASPPPDGGPTCPGDY